MTQIARCSHNPNCEDLSVKPRARSVLPLLLPSDGTFDDRATRVMGEAFDAACEELSGENHPAIVYEAIASRIVAAAGKGERDPQRLKNAGLAGLAR
jgi:hypothetical protein